MLGRKPLDLTLRVASLLTLLGISVRAAASSFEPTLIGLDPWHQHIVVGTQNPLAKQAALLNHTHHHAHEHLQSPVARPVAGEQALVVSIVDNVRAFLSQLSASAGEALLAPQLWTPAVLVSMALALWTAGAAFRTALRNPPPTPPPRPTC